MYYDYSDYTWAIEIIEPPKVVESDPLGNEKIEMVFSFQRRSENFIATILPLMVSLSLIGASLLIDSNKHLRHRLTLYLGLFVFSLNFSGHLNYSLN